MSLDVIKGTSKKPAACDLLIEELQQIATSGTLYTGYPIIPTPEGPFPIDALWASEDFGIVLFDLSEDSDESIEKIVEHQDDAYNKLTAKLRGVKSLMQHRQLKATIQIVTFAPFLRAEEDLTADSIYTKNTIKDLSQNLESNDFKGTEYQELVSVIQNVSTIRKNVSRSDVEDDSRAGKLKKLENSIATLDQNQRRAVIESIDGVQRIRGLAGSGKTVILALKAAYLHAIHPEWKIAVTFNTRALKQQYKEMISNFYVSQTSEIPNWKNLDIIHAWGSASNGDNRGIYYKFCSHQEKSTYRDFRSARMSFGYQMAFNGACQEAVESMSQDVPEYDAILIDEAQDFSKYFLQICFHMLKSKKRLIYAYDELQNLSSSSLPGPEELFGVNTKNGLANVTFDTDQPSQDVVLRTCYRNSRPVLVAAHALGFGVYRHADPRTGTGLIQMFENKDLWTEIGYKNRDEDQISAGNHVKLYRDSNSSPRFLESHSPIDDLIRLKKFDNSQQQAQWISEEISKNLTDDKLRPSDIVVINPNPLTTNSEVGIIRKLLFEKGIQSHVAGVVNRDKFHDAEDSVTFTGIYRAKGNESGMVYVINSDYCYKGEGNLATARNILFTAMTRSKAWVRLSGIGDDMDGLIDEFNKVKDNDFELNFEYPTEDQRQKLKVINRDLSAAEKRAVKSTESTLSNAIEQLERGEVNADFLDPKLRDRLRALLDVDGK